MALRRASCSVATLTDVLQQLLVSTYESVPQRPDEVLLVGGHFVVRMRMSSIC